MAILTAFLKFHFSSFYHYTFFQMLLSKTMLGYYHKLFISLYQTVIIMMNCFLWHSWPTKEVKSYSWNHFWSLEYSTRMIWTCAEPRFGIYWINLSGIDITNPPWQQKYDVLYIHAVLTFNVNKNLSRILTHFSPAFLS